MSEVLALLLCNIVNAREELDNARIVSKFAQLEFDRRHFEAKIPALQGAFIKAEALLSEAETWQERLESVDRLKARIVELETWLEDRDRTIASLTEARR